MSIESVGVYSPNTVYGELTMPFLNKPVTINAHTEFDKNGEGSDVFSKESFYNNQPKELVSIEDIRELKGIQLDDKILTKIGPEVPKIEFPPKFDNVESFQFSKFQNGTGIVYEALQNGYAPNNAIIIGKAHQAYQDATKYDFANALQNLASNNYKVS